MLFTSASDELSLNNILFGFWKYLFQIFNESTKTVVKAVKGHNNKHIGFQVFFSYKHPPPSGTETWWATCTAACLTPLPPTPPNTAPSPPTVPPPTAPPPPTPPTPQLGVSPCLLPGEHPSPLQRMTDLLSGRKPTSGEHNLPFYLPFSLFFKSPPHCLGCWQLLAFVLSW